MKRILTTLALAATFCTATAGTALAKKYPPHPHDPHVAFTGANVNMGIVIFGALLIVGIASLLLSRRRAPASA